MEQIVFSFNCCTFSKKKLSDPNFHLIALPPCIRFAVCCHLRRFMAEHWQCLPTLPHMPCYYHQPALRIYSSTSSALFFSVSIHKHYLMDGVMRVISMFLGTYQLVAGEISRQPESLVLPNNVFKSAPYLNSIFPTEGFRFCISWQSQGPRTMRA